ncbi:MAG TPA: cupin domain-containing protein [Bryobacteraceae bacterium]|nr:cupin domain-containing protein [Bryobacteraceae bacterium]
MNYSRRDLRFLLPILAARTAPADTPKLLPSRAFRYADLPVRANGQNKGRAVLNGATHSGFPIELHLTELGPGQEPHPPHKHVHEEMVLLERGTLDVTIDGETTRLTPGSVAFVASNQMHGWKNPGDSSTEYFVIAFGRDES